MKEEEYTIVDHVFIMQKEKKIAEKIKTIRNYIDDNPHLLYKGRKGEIPVIRFILWNYLHVKGNLTLKEVGELFDRDHSTVIHGIKEYDDKVYVNDAKFLMIRDKMRRDLNILDL